LLYQINLSHQNILIMKQIIIAISFMLSSLFGNTTDRIVTENITAAFSSQFATATTPTWTQVKNLYKASFTLEGRAVSAFYNQEGDLVAVTKHISIDELPQATAEALKSELNEGWISELFVMSTDEGDSYYAKIESAGTATVLHTFKGKKWNVFDKMSK
jgi:hypothetical protein